MQFAAAAHLECVGAVGFVHAQGHVGLKLAHETGAQVAAGDVFALAARKGAVVDREGHGDGRLGDAHKGQGLHLLGRAHGIADADILDTAHGPMSPMEASLAGTRLRPSKVYRLVSRSGWDTFWVS